MTTGEKITSLRKQKGISQEELAFRMNVSRQAVSKWENDATAPTNDNLVALAQLLGTSVSSLLDDDVLVDGDKIKYEKELQHAQAELSKLKSAIGYMKIALFALALLTVVLLFKDMHRGRQIDEAKAHIQGFNNAINGVYSEIRNIRFITQEPNSYSNYFQYSDFYVDVTAYDYDTDVRTVKLSIVPDHYDGNEKVRFVLKGENGTIELPAVLENDMYTAIGQVPCVDEYITEMDPSYSIAMYVTDGDGKTSRYPLYYDIDPGLGYRFRIKDLYTMNSGYGVTDGSVNFDIIYTLNMCASEKSCPADMRLVVYLDDSPKPVYTKNYTIAYNGGDIYIMDSEHPYSLPHDGVYWDDEISQTAGTITEWNFSDGVSQVIKDKNIKSGQKLHAYLEFTAQNGEIIRTGDLLK